MDDLSQKINEILADPSMMEQIKSLGSMMGMSGQENSAAKNIQPQPPQPAQPLMPGLSPEMMGAVMKFAPLMSSMNKEDDSTRLLNALRPFLSEKRQSRLDSSIKLLRFMKIIPMLKGTIGGGL